MKSVFLLLCASALIMVGCTEASIVGSGTIISQDRSAGTLNGLDAHSSVNVVVSQGGGHTIRVEADDNIIDRISTKIVNGVLFVEVTGGANISSLRATVYVTTQELRTIVSSGSGNVSVGEGFDVESLVIHMYGSGNVDVKNLQATKVTSTLNGSGNLSLEGTIDNHSSTLKGSGELNAYDAFTKESAIVIFGSGSAHVNTSMVLFADIFGSGDIVYMGNPDVRDHVTGSGKVRRWI